MLLKDLEEAKEGAERAESLLSLVRSLLAAMDCWAVSENGVPEECWQAYQEACEAVDHAVPLTSQPWKDVT